MSVRWVMLTRLPMIYLDTKTRMIVNFGNCRYGNAEFIELGYLSKDAFRRTMKLKGIK